MVATAAETSPITTGTAVVATPTTVEKENVSSSMTAALVVTVMEAVAIAAETSPDDDGNGCGGDTNVDGEGECNVTNDCNAVGDCDGGGDDRRRRFACKYRRRSFAARGGVIRAGLLRFRVVICMKYI